MFFSRLSLLTTLLATTSAWRLIETYDGNNWGRNLYIDCCRATNAEFTTWTRDASLVTSQNGALRIGLGGLQPSGPASVQLRSTPKYKRGLFIFDIAHLPVNECGVWPSLWLLGEGDWPAAGEIDVIEGVNRQGGNQMSLHTLPGCSPRVGPQTGTRVGEGDCGANSGYVGCGAVDTDNSSFGRGFNAAGGGVWAVEWTSGWVKIWRWTRKRVPGDIYANNPNPGSWGTPVVTWTGGCDYDRLFKPAQIVIDTKFCGTWAANKDVWAQSGCARYPGQTCEDHVRQNWGNYGEAYWLINNMKVYQ